MIRVRGGVWLLALVLAAPAAGDWLVMRDGTRLETEGPWRVKGRQVIFTRPGGTLAALRVADVDLESSTEATEAAQRAATSAPSPAETAPTPSERRPVLRLTDDDLRPGGDTPGDEDDFADEDDLGEDDAGSEDVDSEGEEAAAAPSSEQSVAVISWREQESNEIDGLEIHGAVRNNGRGIAANIQVLVKLVDEDGEPLVDARAFLERSSLAPGRSSTFRALLPGVYALLEDPTFTVTSEGFTLELTTGSEGDEDGDASGDGFREPADDLGDPTGDDSGDPAGDDFGDQDGFSEDDELEPLDDVDDGGGGPV